MEENEVYLTAVIDGETVCPYCEMEFEDEVPEHYCIDDKTFLPLFG